MLGYWKRPGEIWIDLATTGLGETRPDLAVLVKISPIVKRPQYLLRFHTMSRDIERIGEISEDLELWVE